MNQDGKKLEDEQQVQQPSPQLIGQEEDQSQPNEEDKGMYPYKYVGYRVFSRWMASDQAFFIVRRFGALNARVMLSMQDKIVQLEDELNGLDEERSKKGPDIPNFINNGSFRADDLDRRKHLIEEELPGKLREYNSFVNEYTQLSNRTPVSEQDRKLVKSWFGYIHPGAIDDEESRYIDCHDDLIPVQPPEGRHGLYSFFEKIVLLMGTTRPYFSRRPREYDVIDVGEETIYVDEKKIGFICSWVIAIIVLIMLIGPLWILEYVNGNVLKLGVITCFITLFAILIAATTASSKTTSRAFGSLVATTAYSAVLVFFLQFGSANRN